MARLFTAGAESGHVNAEGFSGATPPTYDTAIKRSGNYAYKAVYTTSADQSLNGSLTTTLAVGGTMYVRLWAYIPAGLAGRGVRFLTTAVGAATIGFGINSNYLPMLHYVTPGNGQSGGIPLGVSSDNQFPTDAWTLFEYSIKVGIGATDEFVLRMNGVQIGATTTANYTDTWSATATVNLGAILTSGQLAGGTTYLDDIAINDSTGTAENTWPSSTGRVVLLLPASQASVTAATWQKPGGATTNLHTSVDNLPPVGVANSTNVAQAENMIRNAVSNATADVVFNMATYASAGIGANDTINVLQAFAVVGMGSTAVTKTGSLELTANPAQAEVNFGAYGTGAASGTFPSGWQRRAHTLVYNPAVNVASGPTLELGQRTANTTIALACLVGVQVEFTPAVVAPSNRARMLI